MIANQKLKALKREERRLSVLLAGVSRKINSIEKNNWAQTQRKLVGQAFRTEMGVDVYWFYILDYDFETDRFSVLMYSILSDGRVVSVRWRQRLFESRTKIPVKQFWKVLERVLPMFSFKQLRRRAGYDR